MVVPAQRLGKARNPREVRSMKHWLWLALVGLFLAATWGNTSPTQPRSPVVLAAPALTSQIFLVACNGGERTCVIASGEGRSPLGLYVYDSYGNCIARDEATGPKTADDLAVEWFPPANMPYTIEMRNQGLQVNKVDVVFR
jgi:hypothetical protein